jgi:hypothetical protein
MKFLKIVFNAVLKKPSLYFFVFLTIFTIDRHQRYETYIDARYGPFHGDVLEYYTFLPEFFLGYKQVEGIDFTTNKRTVGMAIMYAPAFFIGHKLAELQGYDQTGYTLPYQQCVRWGSILYVIFGLVICRKSLLRFFKEPVVAIALVCVFFGTNLFNYTYSSGEFSHSYLFFLYSAFIFATLKVILDQYFNYLFFMALTAGMVVLIRPTGILILLFPLLFKVNSLKDLLIRVKYLVSKKGVLFLSLVLFCLPLMFQMLVWKKFMGSSVYYSYGEEGFFFSDPQILNFLFSYRKGWFVYTPIMVFSLVGILLSAKKLKTFFLFMSIYFLVNIYILSSWWDWAYGGSFGCRVLIESYAFLVFPFALFVSVIWDLNWNKKKYIITGRIVLLLVFYLLIRLNVFQTWQYKHRRIHWDGMNKRAYNHIFLRSDINEQEMVYLSTLWKSPDPKKMIKGQRDE